MIQVNRLLVEMVMWVQSEKEHAKHMITILYGQNKPIPRSYVPVRQKFNKRAGKILIISCQFSFHYYWKTEDTLRNSIYRM